MNRTLSLTGRAPSRTLKRTSILLSLAALAVVLSASNAAVYVLSGSMDAVQATSNPNNIGNGTGTISGSFDDVTKLLNYTITWQDLTAPVSNMHFHLGAPGVPGGVVLGIPGPWASPQIGSNIPLDMAQGPNSIWHLGARGTAI